MIATPSRRGDDARRLAVRLGAIALLVVPGLVLWLAARLAGGRPTPDLWNWPARAVVAVILRRPFAPWTWVGAPGVASPVLFYLVCGLVVLALGGAAFGAYSVLQGGIAAWFPSLFGRQGSPRPVGRRELAHLAVRGPRPGRMVMGYRGRLLATEPGSSLLVFGARDSGKTSAFCIPIVQEWSGPVVAVCAKPDLVDATAGVRQRLGWVEVCDPSGTTGLGTRHWLPEAGCEDFDTAIRRAGWMRRGVSAEATEADAAAQAILAVSLWLAARRAATLADVCAHLRDCDSDRLRAVAAHAPQADPRVEQALAALAGLAPAARSACCDAVADMLHRTLQEVAAGPRAGRDLHPHELLPRGDGTLYLVASAEEPQRPSPLLCGVLGAVLDEAFGAATALPGQTLERPLLVVLDGVVPGTLLGELAEYVALAGAINATLLVTFLGQGQEWYGSASDALLGSAPAMVFLGGQQDEETLRLAADVARCRAGGTAQPSAPPPLAGLLGPGHAVLLHGDLPPVALWARPWFQTRHLAGLQATRPFVKGVNRIA